MATNIRGRRVIMPGHTAEYDRITRTSPLSIIGAGAGVWIIMTLSAAALGLPNLAATCLMALAAFAGISLIIHGARLAYRNDQRLRVITRDMANLRAVAVFDETAASDQNLWEAADIANARALVEWRVDELDGASVRSPAFESELEHQKSVMAEQTSRIAALVL